MARSADGLRRTGPRPLHQTANTVCKAAFLQHLDKLQPGDEILVTVGGVGSGKGWALREENGVTEALEMKTNSKAVWDSAGDQNATENPWIQSEAESRGLKVNYLYVHADPEKRWSDPQAGVLQRASNPKDGRMVDATVFAESYAVGARNHFQFYESQKSNSSARFVFVDATGSKPKAVSEFPKTALQVDRRKLHDYAVQVVRQRMQEIKPTIVRGALVGERIWQ